MSLVRTAAPFAFAALALLAPPRVASAQAPADTAKKSPVTGTIDLGLVASSGNTNLTTFNLGQMLEYVTGRWDVTQGARMVNGQTDGVETANEYAVFVRPAYGLSTRWKGYVLGSWDRNPFLGITTRWQEGLGLSFEAFHDTRNTLDLDGGLSFFQQEFTSGENTSFPAARAQVTYRYSFTEKAYFQNVFVYLPNLEDANDYRMNNEAAIVAPVAGHLALKASYVLQYQNAPQPGFVSTDNLYTTGLQVTFDPPWSRMTGRLRSLDVFRGLTVAAMILVNNPGSWSFVYPPLEHAEWNGWTPTDLIFPFFLFIVGVSIVVAFTRREAAGATATSLARQALVRGVLIVGIGLLLNGFPRYQFATIRIPGVLQRIGIVYSITAFIFLGFGPTARRRIAALLLVGYWALMTFVPAPGSAAGDLSQTGNLGAWLDRLLLGGHLWTPGFDPEGIFSTVPAIATCLLGTFAGERLLAAGTAAERAARLFLAGAGFMVAGLVWAAWFPINKSLWTSSYVLFTGGMAYQVLAACYWIVDGQGRGSWVRPFEVFGTNALFAFVVSGILARLLMLWSLPGPDGTPADAKQLFFDRVLSPLAGPFNGSLLFALLSVGVMYLLTAFLYRRRWFIRL